MGLLTSVKEFLLKLGVRGGLTHTQTHTYVAMRPVCFSAAEGSHLDLNSCGDVQLVLCFSSAEVLLQAHHTPHESSATIHETAQTEGITYEKYC